MSVYFTREIHLLVEIFNVIAPVFCCALIGYIWGRSKADYPTDFVSEMVFKIAAPCLIISSIGQVALSAEAFWEMAIATLMVLLLISFISIVIIKLLAHDWRIFYVSMAFPNVGNLGLPLSLFAFGEEGLALAVAYFMVISIAHFSLGMAVATGEPLKLSTFVSNPIMWSILIAVILVSGSYSLPNWVVNSVGLIGNMTIPLMLITLGVSLASIKVSQWHKGALYSFLRIGLGGAVAFFVAELLGLEGAAKGVLILQGIMPVAVFNYLFAIKSGKNVEVIASMVMISTLLVMLILPIVLYGLI